MNVKKLRKLPSFSSNRTENDDEYWYRVLDLCGQDNPSHFAVEFPSKAFKEFEYLDSGTYSHVIRAIGIEYNDTPLVFKIIKVVEQKTMDRFNTLSFNGFELYCDVYQEIIITKVLSNLHNIICDYHGYEYQTHTFPKIFCTKIVHGDLPNYFIIRKYDENNIVAKPVERFDDVYGVPREQLVILMKYCGDSLWQLVKQKHRVSYKGQIVGITAEQLLSVCYQVTLALAVAECVYEFEHRDLHVCNILVKKTKKTDIIFILRSVTYRVKSFGVKATIIDATFSRIKLGDEICFTDLTNRLKGTASNPNPDGQDEAYKLMYTKIIDKWKEWYPITNIYWCKYFYNEVMMSEAFINDCDENNKKCLIDLATTIVNYETLTDFIQNMFDLKPSEWSRTMKKNKFKSKTTLSQSSGLGKKSNIL